MRLLAIGCVLALPACASPPPEPLPTPAEIAPGRYLLLRGERDMNDVQALSAVMLFAGKFCEERNQTPALIIDEVNDDPILAFECEPGEVWPPKS